MVKSIKLIITVILICWVIMAGGCNIDLAGLIASNDLGERLKERSNFVFLTENDRTPQLGEEYSFIVLADTHIESGNSQGLEKLAGVIAADNDIKFVIITGDITQYGSDKDIRLFLEIAGEFGVPCYPVAGNHDVYFGNWPVWKKYIGSTRYRIDGDSATLFILDTANAFIGKDQLDWLEREIKTASGNVFVFTHSNLFTGGFANVQQLSESRERARLVSILQGKCDIMFMGHSHKRVIKNTAGVKYISIEDFYSTRYYCLVSVTKTGIKYDFIKLPN